jgi:hypothetical protein
MHPHLPARRAELGVEFMDLRARADADDAGLLPLDCGEGRHVEQHAAFERHGLTVIARRAAARRQRDT